jgi:5-methylcytosine-specific restriction protein A
MPWAPKHPCATPGCAALVERGQSRCHAHRAAYARAYDEERGTPAQRGYDARHRAWRQAILARDPICKLCGRVPSTVADHVTPLRLGGTWALSNGQGVCERCHNRKRGRERHSTKQRHVP